MYRVNLYTMANARGFAAGRAALGYVLECISVADESVVGEPCADIKVLDDITRQQAELMALIYALRRMRRASDIEIYTESSYVADGIIRWADTWQTNEWKKADGREISNKREWMELIRLLKPHNYTVRLREEHKFREWLKTETERKIRKDVENV